MLRKTDLRVDILPYRMGLLTVDRAGNRYLTWCQETNVVRTPKARPLALEDRILNDFRLHADNGSVQYYLDQCDRLDGHHKLRGFAFVRGHDHYRYKTTLILRGSESTHEFAVYPEERIDVAYTFVKEHFLFNTGFICYVYDNTLKAGCQYDVIIRLQNQFDPEDIRDIQTGATVQV